jgi:hypothetical protein
MRDDDVVRLFAERTVANAQASIRLTKSARVQRLARLARRAATMSPREVAHRLAVLARRGSSGAGDTHRSVLPVEIAIACLKDRSPFLAEHAPAAWLPTDLRERILRSADALCNTGVMVFGHVIALDPARLDWCADPVSNVRVWPEVRLTEASAVAYAASADVPRATIVDVKYAWELSRHQYLATLAYAELLQPASGYGERMFALLDSWIEQNGSGVGVNWSSTLEVGVRSIAWIWAFGLLAHSASLREQGTLWFDALARHYDFLRAHLSLYTDRSNHLIGEATALWMLATIFPSLTDAERQQRRAAAVLAVEVNRQVTRDGVTCEQATGYHCFVMDFLCQIAAVASRTRVAIAPVVPERTQRMREFLEHVIGVGGEMPQIGDNDDGRGLPYPAMFSNRERADALIMATDDTLRGGAPWWLGAHGLPSTGPMIARSTLFREGGYAIFDASTPAGDRLHLVFDVGGMEYLPNAAHEHADALSVLVRINTTLTLGDPGAGTYTGSTLIRNGFRGTHAHNTVTIDGLDQADALDTFKWINPVRTRLLAWETGDDADYVAAAHDGYTRLREPAVHVREVLFVRPSFWIVVDRIDGVGTHDVAHTFHCPPDVRVSTDIDAIDALGAAGDGVRIMQWAAHAAARLRTERAPWSSGYGQWAIARSVASATRGSLPLVFVSLLVPIVARQTIVEMMPPGATPTLDVPSSNQVLFRVRDRNSSVEHACIVAGEARNPHVFFHTMAHGAVRRRMLGEAPRGHRG